MTNPSFFALILRMTTAHLIFFVCDQSKSTTFYESVLNIEPRLNVPGMTEFKINEGTILGLMPITGIRKLLSGKIIDPEKANGIPRAELYLIMKEPDAAFRRAINAGAKELSSFGKRDWGHSAAYCSDLDGHILAFACVD